MLCVLRWKLRFWGYYDLEKYFVEKLLRWAVYRNRRFQNENRISKAKLKADSNFGWRSKKKSEEGKYNITIFSSRGDLLKIRFRHRKSSCYCAPSLPSYLIDVCVYSSIMNKL